MEPNCEDCEIPKDAQIDEVLRNRSSHVGNVENELDGCIDDA
jgi:hypothetical protein